MSAPIKTFVEVKVGAHIELRDPTDAELGESATRRATVRRLHEEKAALERQIAEAVRSCPHVVCIDAPGHPFDTRWCYGCGQNKGVV